jgi:hypothetical protein
LGGRMLGENKISSEKSFDLYVKRTMIVRRWCFVHKE